MSISDYTCWTCFVTTDDRCQQHNGRSLINYWSGNACLLQSAALLLTFLDCSSRIIFTLNDHLNMTKAWSVCLLCRCVLLKYIFVWVCVLWCVLNDLWSRVHPRDQIQFAKSIIWVEMFDQCSYHEVKHEVVRLRWLFPSNNFLSSCKVIGWRPIINHSRDHLSWC